jgi:photosystem II stability/assembly factor-like uncharacterized protein
MPLKYFLGIILYIYLWGFGVLNIAFSQQSIWKRTNGPFGGTFDIVSIDPHDNIFALSHTKNLYKSSDNGNSWNGIVFSSSETSINCIGYNLKGDIFIGTSDGLNRSTNGGNNWETLLNRPGYYNINQILILPNGTIFAVLQDKIIFRSSDNGYSWTELQSPDTTYSKCSGIIYSKNNYIYYASYYRGIYRSSDNGKHWISRNYGLPQDSYYENFYITDIISDSSGCLFVSTEISGIYYSTNNGDTWLPTSYKKGWVNCLSVSPDNKIFAGTSGGVRYSDDKGAYWQNWNLDNYNIKSIAIDKKGWIFVSAEEQGIIRSTDNGLSFEFMQNEGLKNAGIYSLAVNSQNLLFAGAINGDIFTSSNNGNNWILKRKTTYTNQGINSFAINSKGYIYAGTNSSYPNCGIVYSTDTGFTWKFKTMDSRYLYLRNIAVDTGDRLYAIAASTYLRSTDGGNSWVDILGGISFGGGYYITAGPDGQLFLGQGLSLYRSDNYGNLWTDIGNGIRNKYINGIVFNSRKDIFITSTDGYIYKSSDNGNSWNKLDAYGTVYRIYSLVIDKKDRLYAGGEGGVITSLDGGKTWITINDGLAKLAVRSLTVDMNGNVFAGTEGDGIFVYGNSSLDISRVNTSIPENYSLLQNYPNPFNPSTNISFQIPISGFVSLKIYNILGKEIKTLVYEYKNSGIYNIEWIPKTEPSGIYFYKIQTSRYSKMMKMIYLK